MERKYQTPLPWIFFEPDLYRNCGVSCIASRERGAESSCLRPVRTNVTKGTAPENLESWLRHIQDSKKPEHNKSRGVIVLGKLSWNRIANTASNHCGRNAAPELSLPFTLEKKIVRPLQPPTTGAVLPGRVTLPLIVVTSCRFRNRSMSRWCGWWRLTLFLRPGPNQRRRFPHSPCVS